MAESRSPRVELCFLFLSYYLNFGTLLHVSIINYQSLELYFVLDFLELSIERNALLLQHQYHISRFAYVHPIASGAHLL